ncbi:MAG: M48 family metalloprotease [Rhodothermales bacterium]|nr:M48 family metalloprotease [Rhodothermales bacterium]
MISRKYFLCLTIFLVAMSGCVVQRSPISGNKRAYAYSWAQEIQIGREADPVIISQYGLYDDPELASYVTRIGQKVLAESHLRRPDSPAEFRQTEFTFRVLDSPVVNAFALPGGFIYVTRGLLAHVDSEAQLAVVLGHEVGHVAGRHASQRALSQQFGQLGLIAGAIAGQELLGLPGQDILSLGGSVAQLMFLRYGRDDERESDELGVEYSALANYESEAGAAFFETLKRLSDKSGQSIPSFLSTHPDPGEREVRIRQLAAEWENRVTMDVLGVDPFMAQIDGIVVGDDPRQGYTENSVFYHPQLRFQFPVPSGFQLINQPSQVAMFNEKQTAIMLFALAQDSESARAAANDFAGQEGFVVVERSRSSTGVFPAEVVIVDVATQDGQEIRVLARFTEYGGNIYSFIGYAAKTDFNNHVGDFSNTMQGFSELRDQEKINVEPTRLKVIRADRSAPLSAFIPAPLPGDYSDEDIAILNQTTLATPVQNGAPVKLIAK